MCFYQIPYEHPHHTLKARNPLKWLGLRAFLYVLRVCILLSYITKFA